MLRLPRVRFRVLAAAAGPLAAAAALIPAQGAAAASTATFWVAPAGASGQADTSCATAAYSTVQSAVAAAQGPVIIQLPASVGADQSTGLSATNCQADDASAGVQVPQSVIEVCAADTGGLNTRGAVVTIRDVTVQGNWPSTVCYDSLYGILVEGGATLRLTGSTVEQAGAYPLNGCQGGVGVEAGFSPTGQIGHAILSNDKITQYQKNGITVDGAGSSATISDVSVTGDGPTSQIAQNGIQFSWGATGSVTHSVVSGNNYTGTGDASSTGILAFGGGGSACGIGAGAPLVTDATFSHNKLTDNDIGVALYNLDSTCTTSASTPTHVTACYNTASNSHGYPGGTPSADANISGFGSGVGYQAGVTDVGNHDVICYNAISGAGYAPLDPTSSLPSPPPPAFVRPVDLVTGPAIDPDAYGNTYDGKAYHPGTTQAGQAGGALARRPAAARHPVVVRPRP